MSLLKNSCKNCSQSAVLSHNPLFQATFALQNGPTCLLKLAGVTAKDLDLGSGIASFDLHLFMIEDETGLKRLVNL